MILGVVAVIFLTAEPGAELNSSVLKQITG